jgi:segregation and condensation protein B
MAWESGELRAAVEALLFASDRPVSTETLCDVLPGASAGSVRTSIEELREIYSSEYGGLQIVNVAGGYHIRTRPEVSHWVERLLRKRRRMRLSQAALETLAIVAYKQPVTKVEIESVRGVDAGGVLGTLLERELVAIRGRSKGPGRPLLYGTTREFLDHFGLNSLEDLPSLEELESLLAKRDEAAGGEVPAQEERPGQSDAPVEGAVEGDEGSSTLEEESQPEEEAASTPDPVIRSPGQRVDG